MKQKTFLVDYNFHGSTYSLDIVAKDWEEARLRLQAIKANGRVEGELVARSPVLFPNFFTWLLRQF